MVDPHLLNDLRLAILRWGRLEHQPALLQRALAELEALWRWEQTLRHYLGMNDGDAGPSVGSLPEQTLPEVMTAHDAIAARCQRLEAELERLTQALACSEVNCDIALRNMGETGETPDRAFALSVLTVHWRYKLDRLAARCRQLEAS